MSVEDAITNDTIKTKKHKPSERETISKQYNSVQIQAQSLLSTRDRLPSRLHVVGRSTVVYHDEVSILKLLSDVGQPGDVVVGELVALQLASLELVACIPDRDWKQNCK